MYVRTCMNSNDLRCRVLFLFIKIFVGVLMVRVSRINLPGIVENYTGGTVQVSGIVCTLPSPHEHRIQ